MWKLSCVSLCTQPFQLTNSHVFQLPSSNQRSFLSRFVVFLHFIDKLKNISGTLEQKRFCFGAHTISPRTTSYHKSLTTCHMHYFVQTASRLDKKLTAACKIVRILNVFCNKLYQTSKRRHINERGDLPAARTREINPALVRSPAGWSSW